MYESRRESAQSNVNEFYGHTFNGDSNHNFANENLSVRSPPIDNSNIENLYPPSNSRGYERTNTTVPARDEFGGDSNISGAYSSHDGRPRFHSRVGEEFDNVDFSYVTHEANNVADRIIYSADGAQNHLPSQEGLVLDSNLDNPLSVWENSVHGSTISDDMGDLTNSQAPFNNPWSTDGESVGTSSQIDNHESSNELYYTTREHMESNIGENNFFTGTGYVSNNNHSGLPNRPTSNFSTPNVNNHNLPYSPIESLTDLISEVKGGIHSAREMLAGEESRNTFWERPSPESSRGRAVGSPHGVPQGHPTLGTRGGGPLEGQNNIRHIGFQSEDYPNPVPYPPSHGAPHSYLKSEVPGFGAQVQETGEVGDRRHAGRHQPLQSVPSDNSLAQCGGPNATTQRSSSHANVHQGISHSIRTFYQSGYHPIGVGQQPAKSSPHLSSGRHGVRPPFEAQHISPVRNPLGGVTQQAFSTNISNAPGGCLDGAVGAVRLGKPQGSPQSNSYPISSDRLPPGQIKGMSAECGYARGGARAGVRNTAQTRGSIGRSTSYPAESNQFHQVGSNPLLLQNHDNMPSLSGGARLQTAGNFGPPAHIQKGEYNPVHSNYVFKQQQPPRKQYRDAGLPSGEYGASVRFREDEPAFHDAGDATRSAATPGLARNQSSRSPPRGTYFQFGENHHKGSKRNQSSARPPSGGVYFQPRKEGSRHFRETYHDGSGGNQSSGLPPRDAYFPPGKEGTHHFQNCYDESGRNQSSRPPPGGARFQCEEGSQHFHENCRGDSGFNQSSMSPPRAPHFQPKKEDSYQFQERHDGPRRKQSTRSPPGGGCPQSGREGSNYRRDHCCGGCTSESREPRHSHTSRGGVRNERGTEFLNSSYEEDEANLGASNRGFNNGAPPEFRPSRMGGDQRSVPPTQSRTTNHGNVDFTWFDPSRRVAVQGEQYHNHHTSSQRGQTNHPPRSSATDFNFESSGVYGGDNASRVHSDRWYDPVPCGPQSTPIPGPLHSRYDPNPRFSQAAQLSEHQMTFSAVSNHILETEIITKSIEKFDGTAPHKFLGWAHKLKEFATRLNLTPDRTVQLWESYASGGPLDMITRARESMGPASHEKVNFLFQRLIKRYASPQQVAQALKKLVDDFEPIKGNNIGDQLLELLDICYVTLYNKEGGRCPQLANLDGSDGILYIRRKLPVQIQIDWGKYGEKYEGWNGEGAEPPFKQFVNFLEHKARAKINKGYEIVYPSDTPSTNKKKTVRAMKTHVPVTEANQAVAPPKAKKVAKQTNQPSRKGNQKGEPDASHHRSGGPGTQNSSGLDNSKPSAAYDGAKYCVYHQVNGHSIFSCITFKRLPYKEKAEKLAELNRCIKCTGNHRGDDCSRKLTCNLCPESHVFLMHPILDSQNQTSGHNKPTPNSEGRVMCTQVCQEETPVCCSKTVLVEVTMEQTPGKSLMAYAIIDEQSNTTLVDERILDFFEVPFPSQEFSIKFATQDCEMATSGKMVTGLQVRGANQTEIVSIPQALSCCNIADTSMEVATSTMVGRHPLIKQFARYFPDFDPASQVLLLIGRNCGRAMATECLTSIEPYVHKGPLGYSVVGSMCTSTSLPSSGKGTVLRSHVSKHEPMQVTLNFVKPIRRPDFNTFTVQPDDDCTGLSSDDKIFLSDMKAGVKITETGHVELPLPVKVKELPDNRVPVYMRSKGTLDRLRSKPSKLKACLESMAKSISAGYVEQIPESTLKTAAHDLTWYLPIFCVEQPKKNKVRLVYDAAAKFDNVSLNDGLRQGPDLNNQLRSVLLRFREKPIGFGADIKSMFNNFMVPTDQRNLLRFYWYQDNNPDSQIVPYRANSHIFGCTSSPAVANFGLKFCASQLPEQSTATRTYIDFAFYVDDGFSSCDEASTAISILKETTSHLAKYNIKLHKVVSNSSEVLDSFPDSDRDLPTILPTEGANSSTLGVAWDTKEDVFMISPEIPSRPFTKRGILSTINSLYDPLGLVSPVILKGRLIQRDILMGNSDLESYGWDTKLPQSYFQEWTSWIQSLPTLTGIKVKRALYSTGFCPARQELHTFCDASEKAIGYVSYLKSVDGDGNIEINLISGSSKLCPRAATTMPRLELCAALEASQATNAILSDMAAKPDSVHLHTDSKIVVGYLTNKTRHFSKYVERRVQMIDHLFPHQHWNYVSTRDNPADHASRPQTPETLLESNWFSGPAFLHAADCGNPVDAEVVFDGALPEEKTAVTVLMTREATKASILSTLFERVGNFSKLLRVCAIILKMRCKLDKIRQKSKASNMIPWVPRAPDISQGECLRFLIGCAQSEVLGSSLQIMAGGKSLPENHHLANLSPQLDSYGIMRVGGRLRHASVEFSVKHPYLIPEKHALALSIVSHFHGEIKHQGIHLSHSAVIQAGYFIENGRRMIRKFISDCIICRKLRADTCTQLMADLPSQRLEDVPIFSHIGIDVFGHWFVHDGRATRRTSANKKVWAVIFVCMPSRAIHLEPLCGMDTTSFRNALTRFMAIRGSVKTIRSDNAGNFLSVRKQMEELNMENISEDMTNKGIKWTLNPPRCSHQNGSIERKIQSVRRVLDTTIQMANQRYLSRDEFSTFLAVAADIVNRSPLWAVSNSPEDPTPISPQMLLTLRPPGEIAPVDTFTEEDALAYGQKRYRRVQFYSEQFWTRWRKEYLHTLHLRHKWKSTKPCIAVGDIVLIRDKNQARNQWPMGRVTATSPSQDGLVRTVTLVIPPLPGKSQTRSIVRGITDLILLIPAVSHGHPHPAP